MKKLKDLSEEELSALIEQTRKNRKAPERVRRRALLDAQDDSLFFPEADSSPDTPKN